MPHARCECSMQKNVDDFRKPGSQIGLIGKLLGGEAFTGVR